MFFDIFLLLATVFVAISASPTGVIKGSSIKSDKQRVELFEKVLNLHGNWWQSAVIGLLDSMKNKVHKELSASAQRRLVRCSKLANDITSKSKCLVQAFDSRSSRNQDFMEWIGGFGINVPDRYVPSTTERVSTTTKTTTATTVQPTTQKTTNPGMVVHHMNKMPHLMHKPQTSNPKLMIAKFLTGLVRNLKGPNNGHNGSDWRQKFDKASQYMKLRRRAHDAQRGTKSLWQRLASIVNLDQQLPTDNQSRRPLAAADQKPIPRETLLSIVDDLASVAYELPIDGKSKTSINLLSPKMLSVMPEEENIMKFLSPTLFGVRNDSQTPILSLPQLMDGPDSHERNAWIDLIMATSGAENSVDPILDYFENPTPKDEQAAVLRANMKMLATWDGVHKLYTKKQKKEMKDEGYAFLSKEQMLTVYSRDSPYKLSEDALDIDIEKYGDMTDAERQLALEDIVRNFAGGKSDPQVRKWSRRLKQTTLTPLVLSPALIGNPQILGPVTLSPFVFVPLIMSPLILSPVTLSPLVGAPLILSPFVLSPIVLSPLVLSPIILSPSVLAPLILDPWILSPFILSPIVMDPVVLSPFVLSPLILSPFVLTPIVLSPQVLGGVILSPRVLSPLVETPTVLFAAVLSPAVLS